MQCVIHGHDHPVPDQVVVDANVPAGWFVGLQPGIGLQPMEFEARLIVEVDFRRAGAAAEHKGDQEYGQAHRIISICLERSAASKTVSPGHHDHAVIRYGKSRGIFGEVESDALTAGNYNILVYDAVLQIRAGTHPDPVEEDGCSWRLTCIFMASRT